MTSWWCDRTPRTSTTTATGATTPRARWLRQDDGERVPSIKAPARMRTASDEPAREDDTEEPGRAGRSSGGSRLRRLAVTARETASDWMTTAAGARLGSLAGLQSGRGSSGAVALLCRPPSATGLLVYMLGQPTGCLGPLRSDGGSREFEAAQGGNDRSSGGPSAALESWSGVPPTSGTPRLRGARPATGRRCRPWTAHPRLFRSATFLDIVERRMTTGGSRQIDTGFGEVIVTVPGAQLDDAGRWSSSTFCARRAKLVKVMQTYAIVSLLLLGLIRRQPTGSRSRSCHPLAAAVAPQEISEGRT